ncbi:class I SAM-dependent methyltransferase [Bradyrhizobium sp. CB82]|uniref:class I SAM-dependent methyltransferase n=1 Tax=Bradyrhizobium sp. CB82 TaxID=3039159 RepID=UPI0024B0FBCA|nr:class I SAM-dependent methyltransferase [Bradyrhizobium sp. CB82]WFU40197.1 class I SAM-dependent methyltransferase [Bradyrhizobium sp. CB82]
MTEHTNNQKAHFESIHDAYEAHYYDKTSMAYRHQFIYAPLFANVQLNRASVADLACGSGHNSLALRRYFPSVRTTGYDISERACRDYQTSVGSAAHQVDLTRPLNAVETHDAAVVIGGLQYCIVDLETTMRNVARMLRPGGRLFMMEPNDEFLLSSIRRLWYRKDRWFEGDSEAALKHDEIASLAAPYFVTKRVIYAGGPAFYLIFNSLITRVRLRAKPYLAPLLFPFEELYNLLPGRSAYAMFLAEWQRTKEIP